MWLSSVDVTFFQIGVDVTFAQLMWLKPSASIFKNEILKNQIFKNQ